MTIGLVNVDGHILLKVSDKKRMEVEFIKVNININFNSIHVYKNAISVDRKI